MNLEQLAIISIAVFSFMAITTALGAIRSAKRMGKANQLQRIRRLVGSAESARAIAESIVREIAANNEQAVEVLRTTGQLDKKLEDAIADARSYFLGRVEPRHRTIFSEVVDKILYQIQPDNKPQK